MVNAQRQNMKPSTQTTSSNVNAPPQRALNQIMPCARTYYPRGNHNVNALVRLGKHPASPAPNKNRVTINEAWFHAQPVAAVKKDHMITTHMRTLRGPIQSPNQPPKISKSA